MKKILYYAGLVCMAGTVLFNTSCQKKCTPPTDESNFTDTDLIRLPYTGTENLKLIHNNRDTFIIKGGGFKDSTVTHKVNSGECGINVVDRYRLVNYKSSDGVHQLKMLLNNLGNSSSLAFHFQDSVYAYQFIVAQQQYHAITIQGTNYTNLEQASAQFSSSDTSSYTLYNSTAGLVRIKYKPNDIWDIIR